MFGELGAVKIIGLAATVIGVGASITSQWVAEKRMEETVNEKVEAALKAREGDLVLMPLEEKES